VVAHAFLDGVGRRHSVAVAIEQHPGEQARLARWCAGVALGGIGGELGLNRIPERLIDDRRVFAPMGLSLVNATALQTRRPASHRRNRSKASLSTPRVPDGVIAQPVRSTILVQAGGALENAQAMAGHDNPRATKLYDRAGDEFTPDEVERIRSEPMVPASDPKTSPTGTILRLYR
jgi:hypothetical protein